MARDTPHLFVVTDERGALVGPLRVPGVGACGLCDGLARAAVDPAWPLLSLQLSRATCRRRPPDVQADVAGLVAGASRGGALGAWRAGDSDGLARRRLEPRPPARRRDAAPMPPTPTAVAAPQAPWETKSPHAGRAMPCRTSRLDAHVATVLVGDDVQDLHAVAVEFGRADAVHLREFAERLRPVPRDRDQDRVHQDGERGLRVGLRVLRAARP